MVAGVLNAPGSLPGRARGWLTDRALFFTLCVACKWPATTGGFRTSGSTIAPFRTGPELLYRVPNCGSVRMLVVDRAVADAVADPATLPASSASSLHRLRDGLVARDFARLALPFAFMCAATGSPLPRACGAGVAARLARRVLVVLESLVFLPALTSTLLLT